MTEHALAAYGKLPLSKEFLRHGCYDSIGKEFRNWLDAGHDRFAGNPEHGKIASGNPRRLLFLPSDTSHMLAGVTMNSADASGGRRFPFAVFTSLKRKGMDPGRVMTALEPLWITLESELNRLGVLADTDTFFQTLRECQLDPGTADDAKANVATQEFAAARVHDWVGGLYRYDPVDLWVRGLWRLLCLRPALEAQARSPQLSAVRVPLSRALPQGPQIDLWRTLLRSLHGSFKALPTVVCPGSEDREPAVHLLYRSAEAGDFPPLVGAGLDGQRFTDLVEAGGRLPVDGFGAFRELLEDGPLAADATIGSLAEFSVWG